MQKFNSPESHWLDVSCVYMWQHESRFHDCGRKLPSVYLFRTDFAQSVFSFNEWHAIQRCILQNPNLKLCQKAVSTPFWTCREEPLCLKAALCPDTSGIMAALCVWMSRAGFLRVPVCFHTLSSLSLLGLHLVLTDILMRSVITGHRRFQTQQQWVQKQAVLLLLSGS